MGWLLRTYPKAQTHGIVVVEDLAGFSFKNCDRRLISSLEKAFSNILRVRIAAMHCANAGFLIRTLFALSGAFFSDKLKARIGVYGKGDVGRFGEFFHPDQIPTFLELGGTVEWTRTAKERFSQRMIKDSGTWSRATGDE